MNRLCKDSEFMDRNGVGGDKYEGLIRLNNTSGLFG